MGNTSIDQRDCSGVSTYHLAGVMRSYGVGVDEEVPVEAWVNDMNSRYSSRFDKYLCIRKVRRILAHQTKFTEISTADRICFALDTRVDWELQVFAAPSRWMNGASRMMAMDEFRNGFDDEVLATEEEITARAAELDALRESILATIPETEVLLLPESQDMLLSKSA